MAIGLLLLLTVLVDLPVCFAQGTAEQKKTVAFVFGTIHVPVAEGKTIMVEQPLGTAFFVIYPDKRGGPDYGFVYLVTAKHVLKDADGKFLREIKLRVNLKDESRTEFIQSIPVTDSEGNLTWFHDNNDAVDVAAIPFLPDPAKFDFKAIPIDSFVDDAFLKERKISEGDVVYFIGLMAQYYGDKRNSPVIRRGTLALMTDEQIETPTGRQNAFIAELASWPGNSGSPVFLNLGGLRGNTITIGQTSEFLGILVGGYLDKIKGSTLDATLIRGSGLPIGVSFIVPAPQIRALLDSATAKAHRYRALQGSQPKQ